MTDDDAGIQYRLIERYYDTMKLKTNKWKKISSTPMNSVRGYLHSVT